MLSRAFAFGANISLDMWPKTITFVANGNCYVRHLKITPGCFVFIAGFQCHAIQNRSKIKIKTIWQIKSRIWEMKGGKYTKTLAKIWVEGIICIRDIRGNVLPKFIELCTETPCWSSSGWAPTWRTTTNRNVCYRVLIEKREFTPRGTYKH